MQEFAALKRRVVAALQTDLRQLTHAGVGMVIQSLLRQRPNFECVYVFVRARRRMRHCAPSWLGSRRGVVVVCQSASSQGPAHLLMDLLSLETSPGTFVFLCDDSHRYGSSLLKHLVSAADIFAGSAIGAVGYAFGSHGGPIPIVGLGFLLYRSFVDTSLQKMLSGPCRTEGEMALVAHLVNKGVRVRILGDAFGTRRLRRNVEPWHTRGDTLSTCRGHLLGLHPLLWVSKFPERCVLYVSVLEGTDDFLLGLTIRYAGLQTRKPDEVVLIAMNDNLLQKSVRGSRSLAIAELDIAGSIGKGTTVIRTQRGAEVEVPLSSWLAGIRDRTGVLVRLRSDYGPSRSFVLSVASVEPCPGGQCSVMPSLLKAFERELDPDTSLFFASAERLVNERVVAENLDCISACRPKCSSNSWCGQSATRSDGAIYDLTLRRVAGYRDHTPGQG